MLQVAPPGALIVQWRFALRGRTARQMDSSVLIAASISRAGVCAKLLEDVLTHHELVVSGFIVEDLGRKPHDKFEFARNEIRQLQRFLSRVATPVLLCGKSARSLRRDQQIRRNPESLAQVPHH